MNNSHIFPNYVLNNLNDELLQTKVLMCYHKFDGVCFLNI